MVPFVLCPVLEAPAFVAGLDDLAMVCEAVEERGGHLGIAEDGRPLTERQVGGDDDRGELLPNTWTVSGMI